jgi:hypothetical protein
MCVHVRACACVCYFIHILCVCVCVCVCVVVVKGFVEGFCLYIYKKGLDGVSTHYYMYNIYIYYILICLIYICILIYIYTGSGKGLSGVNVYASPLDERMRGKHANYWDTVRRVDRSDGSRGVHAAATDIQKVP